jgi:phosphate-selective porin OprO/OprP
MRKSIWTAAIASAAVAALSGAALAQDQQPSTAELKAQIDALQRQINQIQAREAAAPENQATAAAVQQDAAAKSQVMGPIYGGWNKGFRLQSADGKFSLQPGFLFQFRNITNYRSDEGDLENGFEFRRLRLYLGGNMFSKQLKYFIQLDNNRNTGSTTLLDAYAQYNFTNSPWAIKFGQYRNSWVHEGDVGDKNQLADERSLIDYTLGGSITDRVQGVALRYEAQSDADPFYGELSFHDSDNSKNTDFRDNDFTTPGRVNGNFGASARLNYKIFGHWDDYQQFSARGIKEDLLVAGGGIDFSEAGDTNVTRLTTDLQWANTQGFSAYGELNYNNTTTGSGGGSGDDYGALGQVGWVIDPSAPQWEVFARYAYVHLDADIAGEDNFHEIAAGVNYFFGPNGSWGNNVRLTVDLNYLPNGSPGNITGLGYLGSSGNEIVLRTQLQLQL